MRKLTGETRLEFFYNQGIRYGAQGSVHIGYFREVDEAYNHLKEFKPF